MTKKVNGKERTIEEEIFDKSSDRIARLVNKIWLCRYPRCRYLIYNNRPEFKLHFETLCSSCIQRKPTKIKNLKVNAICERVHHILGTMVRTSEIDMANSVEPAYIDTSIRAPWSESLSLNNEVNNCPSVCVCVCVCVVRPPTNYHENSV